MLSIFDFARDLNFLGVSFRLILAMICGGLIGLEREYKRRPAGFRTHILICLGAAITNMTNLYLFLKLNKKIEGKTFDRSVPSDHSSSLL